jgi:hypothetical protein
MKVTHYLKIKINKTIGRLLYFFRCPAIDRYIHRSLKKQGIVVEHRDQDR